MSPAQIERTKLLATFFNNLAVACLVAGAIGPLSGFLRIPENGSIVGAVIGAITWTLAGLGFRRLADNTLGRLDQ